MRVAKRNTAAAVSIPAPIGGWNARDALGDMEATDAVSLLNFWPRTSDVQLRKGYTRFSTGLGEQVNSLLAYAGAASTKLFAGAGSSIFDISAGGAVGAADVTGLSNVKFEYINVSTAGGNFMLAVNGADKLQGYNGTSWYVDGDGTADITGVDTAGCTNINLHKTRVWLIQGNTLTAWYLPVNSIAGAAASFSFKAIARKGGYLVAMATWTMDGGSGIDDFAVFITNKGEVIVYAGTDPSSASTWALAGVWELAPPVSRRCFIKYMGDLLILTQDGLMPLSSALKSSRVNPSGAITNKIQSAITEATVNYGSNFGWGLKYYPKANMLIINVPIAEGNLQQQYVMNTVTKAWARFEGFNANCFEIWVDEPYFGSDGFVGKAWDGLVDNTSNINATAKQAFNYFGSRGKLKRWTMIRPVILTNGSPGLKMNLNVDFDDSGTTTDLSYTSSSGSLWDTAVWDTDTWGAGLTVQKAWQGVNGVGYCAAPRLQAASQGIEVYWASSDVIMETGAFL